MTEPQRIREVMAVLAELLEEARARVEAAGADVKRVTETQKGVAVLVEGAATNDPVLRAVIRKAAANDRAGFGQLQERLQARDPWWGQTDAEDA